MLKNRDFLTILEQFQKKKISFDIFFFILPIFLCLIKKDENINQKHWTVLKQQDICIISDVHFAELCFFKGFLVFEIRKNLDLRKIFVTPKIFLKLRFHCTYREVQR